jgi:hypothetical protein
LNQKTKEGEAMTTPFWMGIILGLLFMFVIHLSVMSSYKRILVMKAKDGTAENINGKFYYIKEEGK